MIVYNCENCGEPMEITGEMRVCICKNCGSSRIFPEAWDATSEQTESVPQDDWNAMLLLQEADAAWKQLAQNDFAADSHELRALAQKYEQLAKNPPKEASDAPAEPGMFALAEKCANKAAYCRYLGAVSDLKRPEDPETEEKAYNYLVSLGDYEDAPLILDKYRYKMLRTEKKERERKRERNEYRGLVPFLLVLAGISLAFGIFAANMDKKNGGGIGRFLWNTVQGAFWMMLILCIPVALYLIGDRIVKWYKKTVEESEEAEEDEDSEEGDTW